MTAAKSTTRTAVSADVLKRIIYLVGALKATRVTEAATRLADQVRDAGLTHEDYLADPRPRSVSINASGAQSRSRGRQLRRGQDPRGLRLGAPTLDPPAGWRTWIGWVPDLGPRCRPARPTRDRQDTTGHRTGNHCCAPTATRSCSRLRPTMSPETHRRLLRRTAVEQADPAAALRADHRRRGWLLAIQPRGREFVLPTRVQPLRTRLIDPHA